MDQPKADLKVKEPFTGYGRYHYADYLGWQMEEMVELIKGKGKVFRTAAAAPSRIHQENSGKFSIDYLIFWSTVLVKYMKHFLTSVFR